VHAEQEAISMDPKEVINSEVHTLTNTTSKLQNILTLHLLTSYRIASYQALALLFPLHLTGE